MTYHCLENFLTSVVMNEMTVSWLSVCPIRASTVRPVATHATAGSATADRASLASDAEAGAVSEHCPLLGLRLHVIY